MSKQEKQDSEPAENPQEDTPETEVKRPETLPYLLDFSFSATSLVVLFTGLATAGISLLAHAPLWMIALRTGAAMLIIGLVLWGVNYRLSKGSLEAARQDLLQRLEAARDKEICSTVEKMA